MTKASGNDRGAHTGVFLTRVPEAGFPAGSALRDAPQGWPMQGGHFGSAPAHSPFFPVPCGAAGATELAVLWPGCGYWGRLPGQVSTILYFFPVCQTPRSTVARRMEHPAGLRHAGGMLRESTVCAKNPSERENCLLLKKRGFSCD